MWPLGPLPKPRWIPASNGTQAQAQETVDDILHDLLHQNLRSSGSIAYIGCYRMYSINTRSPKCLVWQSIGIQSSLLGIRCSRLPGAKPSQPKPRPLLRKMRISDSPPPQISHPLSLDLGGRSIVQPCPESMSVTVPQP